MIKETDCVLIMGTRGTGKSFLGRNLQKLWPRRVIFDPLDEYESDVVATNFSELAEILAEFDRTGRDRFEIVVKSDPEVDRSDEELEQMLRICYYFGHIQIVMEEVQLCSTPHSLPKWLKNALLTGRHQGLSLLFTTQRPGELNKTILSQCNHIFCGRIVEGNDVRYVSSFLNESSDRLSSLPDRKFLYFHNGRVLEVQNSFDVAR